MKVLVTGAAGFIGATACQRLLQDGCEVVGIDVLNDYYTPALKYARLQRLGLSQDACQSTSPQPGVPGFRFAKLDVADASGVDSLFRSEKFDTVLHLAAQAGVRYSLENPWAYLHSNINGTLAILEACRHHPVRHLVYASSSSVYGENGKTPFAVQDPVDHPLSLYAATKKSNELMAHTYAHLYGIAATGLRFFTVYGPWGRPDMAPMLFASAILAQKPIRLFNQGNMRRDFTYVDDIVEGTVQCLYHPPQREHTHLPCPGVPHCVHNIGRGSPMHLLEFVELLENALGQKAIKELAPMQAGDVPITWADTTSLENAVGYKPAITPQEGVARFGQWYLEHRDRGIF